MRYLFVLYILISFSGLAFSQDAGDEPTFEEQESTELPPPPDAPADEGVTANEEEIIDEAGSQSAEDENNMDMNTGQQNNDFDVFRPSEEISEDLAVPFPADI